MILETTQLSAETFNKKALEDALNLISHYPGFLSYKISKGAGGRTIIEAWWTDEESLKEFHNSGSFAKWQFILQTMATAPLIHTISPITNIGLSSCGG